MSSERSADGSESDGGTEPVAAVRGRLGSVYREYVGEPAQERDISLGFGLFFAGVALAAIGFVLFLYSNAQVTGTTAYWQLREIAFVAGVLGLPAVLLSVVVLLPVGKRTRLVSFVGSAFCLLAAGILVSVFPFQWTTQNTVDGSVMTISVYAVGLVTLSAATGTALVAQYLDKATQAQQAAASEDDGEEGESVSDEDVAADIEKALDDTELSWGGVEQQPNTKRLKLDMPEADTSIERDSLENAEATTTRSESDTVDDAVSGLRSLQGGESKTATTSSTEDQVDALTQFREQQAEDEEVETGVDQPSGIIDRIRRWLAR